MRLLGYLLLGLVDLAIGLAAYLLAGSSIAYGTTAAALALPLIVLLLSVLGVGQKRTGNAHTGHAVIICGPAGTGKTTLLLSLSEQATVVGQKVRHPLTAPSAAVNEAKLVRQPGQPSASSPITLIDVPGSEKIRNAALTEVLPDAGKLVLLFDARTVEDLPTEAPFIIRVLAEAIRRHVPCVLVLGKQDLGPGSTVEFVQALDAALESISSRAAAASPEDMNEELAEHVRCIQDHLGIASEDPIAFDHLNVPVMLYSSNDEQSLLRLRTWICDA